MRTEELEQKLIQSMDAHSATLTKFNELQTEHLKTLKNSIQVLKDHVELQKFAIKQKKLIKRYQAKDPFKFPETLSFMCGIVGASAMTAAVAGHPDWVWTLAAIPLIGYAAWKGIKGDKDAANITNEEAARAKSEG